MGSNASLLGRFVSALLGVLLVLALVAAVVGMTRDNTFDASASVVVEAPLEAVHPFVADPHQHSTWMGWNDDQDPTLQRTYEGPSQGVGAAVRWTGELFGVGSLRIEAADPAEGVRWHQVLPAGVESTGQVRYEPLTPERTRVTWRETGTVPRPHGPFFTGMVSRSLQSQIEGALGFLAAACEGRPPPRPPQPGASR